ncbi:Resolvase domain protein [Crinalium epipsammum PCC 9333]|uniref:Resolvase domain protein n=1 Tax=Crinalium epipsammum PCC 9333 TaxID=1173022 RepID=K9W073_9CYAN|nr:recombinase family protein [Crinalium epipsammum]AFZ13606.1 Resolvase domain protein [Crinalium epipsammum PCC 9333]
MAKGFSNKAAIYIRVSTSEQVTEGVSLDAQLAKLTTYCQQAGLEVVAVIRDEGVSAGKLLIQREGGAKLLEMIHRKEVTHVVALKLDRLFRNAGDALSTIDRWDGGGVTTHLIDFMGGQTLDTRSPMGRMMLGIAATFAQFERDLCGQRTKDALRHKKQNRQAYSPTPLGYVRDGSNLVANATEQAIITVIKSLRLAGKSLRAIATELTQRGLKTKRGGSWYASTIKAILSNDLHYSPG